MKRLLVLAFLLTLNGISLAQSLQEAVESGDQKAVRHLISQSSEASLEAALIVAVGYPESPFIDLLVEAGADLNCHRGYDGETALHKAARIGNTSNLERLLALGADPNAQDNNSSTPLHQGALNGNLPCLKLLLEAGADPDARDARGRVALDYADDTQDRAVYPLLCESASALQAPLRAMIAAGELELVKSLLDRGGVVEPELMTLAVSQKENLALVRTLAEAGGDSAIAFPQACASGQLLVATWILDQDIEIDLSAAVAGAIQEGRSEVVRFLLSKGARPQDPGIDLALLDNKIERLEAFIERKSHARARFRGEREERQRLEELKLARVAIEQMLSKDMSGNKPFTQTADPSRLRASIRPHLFPINHGRINTLSRAPRRPD
jgi:uncharacterized protein